MCQDSLRSKAAWPTMSPAQPVRTPSASRCLCRPPCLMGPTSELHRLSCPLSEASWGPRSAWGRFHGCIDSTPALSAQMFVNTPALPVDPLMHRSACMHLLQQLCGHLLWRHTNSGLCTPTHSRKYLCGQLQHRTATSPPAHPYSTTQLPLQQLCFNKALMQPRVKKPVPEGMCHPHGLHKHSPACRFGVRYSAHRTSCEV
jgi:hypothetical protein